MKTYSADRRFASIFLVNPSWLGDTGVMENGVVWACFWLALIAALVVGSWLAAQDTFGDG